MRVRVGRDGRVVLMTLTAAVVLCCRLGWAQQVRMPLEQYEQLRARARPVEVAELAPAAPFALESDQLAVTAGATSARVVQTLVVRALAADWLTIPVGEMGGLVDADLGGFEGRVANAGGGVTLIVRGKGVHTVRLESVVPVARDAAATRATWGFKLRLPPAAVAKGELALVAPLAASVDQVTLGEGGVLLRGGAGWSFAAVPGKEMEVRLLGVAETPERARLPLRWDATAATWAVASRNRLQVRAWVVARVAQGQLEELRLRLPEGCTVERVGGPVAGWKVEGGVLVVTPLVPAQDLLKVSVELTGAASDAFASPLLLPLGAARTVLLARATVEGDGLLELADPGAAHAADEVELAPVAADLGAPAGAKVVRVDDAARPPRWHAIWAEGTQVLAAQTDELWVEVAAGEAGRASYQVWAAVRNRGAANLAVSLPAGFQLSAASRDGVPVPPGVGADQALLVPLGSRDAPQVVHLAGLIPWPLPGDGGGKLQVPLPALSAPAAGVWVRALLPGDRTYTLADATRATAAATFAPPMPVAVGSRSAPAADLAGQMTLRPAAGAALDGGAPTALGSGFVEIDAAWSALSSNPAPLLLQVAARKEKASWF